MIFKIACSAVLLIAFFLGKPVFSTNIVYAASLKLGWDANNEPDLSGYLLYYGTSSHNYGPPVDMGNVTEYRLNNLVEGVTYYIGISAVDINDNESEKCDELSAIARDTELLRDIPISGVVIPGEEVIYYIDVPAGQDTLEVVLSGNNDADLYVKCGAPPTTSDWDCRSYSDGSDESCSFDYPEAGRWYIMVRGYAASTGYQIVSTYALADVQLQNGTSFSGTVTPGEEDLYYIDIPASQATLEVVLTGNNDADLYVKCGAPPTTSDWDCRSYSSGSDESCFFDNPERARWYIMVRGYSGTVNYQVVASSVKELANAVPSTEIVRADEQDYYYLDVPPNQSSLDIELTGNPDADLYVRYGTLPTTSDWDCRPFTDGSSNESCSFDNPAAGRWYIMVKEYSGDVFYQIVASYSGNELELPNGVGDRYWVTPGEEEHYYIDVPLSQSRLEVVLSGNNDADLYVRYGTPPTTSDWDCRPFTGGTNETCSFNNPEAGRWYIMVKGYAGTVTYSVVAEFY